MSKGIGSFQVRPGRASQLYRQFRGTMYCWEKQDIRGFSTNRTNRTAREMKLLGFCIGWNVVFEPGVMESF